MYFQKVQYYGIWYVLICIHFQNRTELCFFLFLFTLVWWKIHYTQILKIDQWIKNNAYTWSGLYQNIKRDSLIAAILKTTTRWQSVCCTANCRSSRMSCVTTDIKKVEVNKPLYGWLLKLCWDEELCLRLCPCIMQAWHTNAQMDVHRHAKHTFERCHLGSELSLW